MAINKEIKIALTAICTIMLLFYGINFLKGINMFKENNMYYVSLHDITGLSKNNSVYANGFPVGTVREIEYDYKHPGNVIVGVEIDRRMHLPKGTYAELTSSMLGATTMNLILGTEKDFLKPNDSIIGAPETSAVAMVTTMIPKVEALLPKIDSILTSINTLFADPTIKQTLQNVQYVTTNLKTTTDQINHILYKDVPQVTRHLDNIGQNVDQLTTKLKVLDYAQTLNNINRTLHETHYLITDLNDKINSQNNSLGMLLNNRNLYDNLNKTLISSDSLLIDIKTHPKRYVHFSIFGKKEK